jgi:predicted metal-dependent peptidase
MNPHDKRLSAAQLRLRQRHPFFATLALFAPVVVSDDVETAATDGKTVYFCPAFLGKIDNGELDAVLLHEVLHAALLHLPRRGNREPTRWNYAADIVVNGMVRKQGLTLPQGALINEKWEDHSVEEIYQMLLAQGISPPAELVLDLVAVAGDVDAAEETSLAQQRRHELETYWKAAHSQAEIIGRQHAAKGRGNDAGGYGRDWDALHAPNIDWRSELWRFLVRTPTDFTGYDRRFIYRGLYLDAMEGVGLRVWVAVDTSGSIGKAELNAFHSEIIGILCAYPHVECQLFFADTSLYGPYPLGPDSSMPEAKGGGGTSFVPFFNRLAKADLSEQPDVCVYLTDGYCDFPKTKPEIPTLWVVTVPGLEAERFPFGMVVQMLGEI